MFDENLGLNELTAIYWIYQLRKVIQIGMNAGFVITDYKKNYSYSSEKIRYHGNAFKFHFKHDRLLVTATISVEGITG